ncbi:MAG: purine-binding chemotaxis protein CheW [Desulfobacterales bacterium]|nr:purine-binding chemotaxis protein CheW [Desulfobacterales bacterium]
MAQGPGGDSAALARTMDQAVKAVARMEGKYLTFAMAGEEYGIGILKVKEIIGMMPVTTIPRTPDFVKGVINLRGKVIPVLDLRLKFGIHELEYTERTCIIVVESGPKAGDVLIGIVVDAVSEVINIKADDIEETPTFGTKLNTDYILGMAKMGGGVKILLDIEKVLTAQELDLMASMKEKSSSPPAEAAAEETPEEETIEQAAQEETPAETVSGLMPEEAIAEVAVE